MSDLNIFQQYFPFSSQYSTWEDWNGNLIIWYGQESIPSGPEEDWRMIAEEVAELPTFSAYPVPTPGSFETWQEWADEFSQIINGPSR